MTEWIGKGGDFLAQVAVRFKRGSMPGLYRDVFDSFAGRIVLADLHRKAGVMQTHEGWTDDQLQYTTGRRDMVLYIDAMLRLKPQELQQLADMETLDE